MLLLDAKLSLKSRRQVTKSMEGQDKMQRSESKSLGPGKGHKDTLVKASVIVTLQCDLL